VVNSTNPSTGLTQQRRLVTELPGPRSRQLLARRQAAVSGGVNITLPVFIAAAGGGVLLDVDGNSLIDLGSGIAVTSVGNAAPAVVAAVQAQVEHFTHTCFMVTPYESYLAVCEELAAVTPGEHEKRSALFNSGAEAVENAVKVARHATGRAAVVVVDHGYLRWLFRQTCSPKDSTSLSMPSLPQQPDHLQISEDIPMPYQDITELPEKVRSVYPNTF
jgi:4-aminobutyrate aminotransferase / (S)-3-amino-2-methylpropionate transaminase / 5-aminovalerate transaminase